jgi:cyanophycin synthetase
LIFTQRLFAIELKSRHYLFALVSITPLVCTPILSDLNTSEPNTCFADSRRLTGPNRYFGSTGAVLEALGFSARDAIAHERWREAVISVCAALGWYEPQPVVQRHASGTLLAFAAPPDQLFTATEINECAWEQASGIFASIATANRVDVNGVPFDQVHIFEADFASVVAAFKARAATESNPTLTALRAAARSRDLPVMVDDDYVSIGAGSGSETWQLAGLPAVENVSWPLLHDIPTALVTGSNGKTTVVRLLAAILKASGKRTGYSSTEGVMIDGHEIDGGDFSGPAGARLVLRDISVEAAVLETARGGILRRGLATARADVAVITNISADHFGEYGIDNLNDLADVKLTVARTLGTAGTLVLNADDPVLLSRASSQKCKVALFAYDDSHPSLVAHRLAGGTTCGVNNSQLMLTLKNEKVSLGAIADMPLTINGAAIYNVANISVAALAATALGIAPQTISAELMHFGSARTDNPGRLERWDISGVTVVIDYAHNPSGLSLLMNASLRNNRGRVGLLLGQAGNRGDDAIKQLGEVAASYKPDLVIIKELSSMLRGRAVGEVPALLQAALVAKGFPAANIIIEADEADAARRLLEWAQPNDILIMPIHQQASRAELVTLLDRLQGMKWRVGSALPGRVGNL